MVSTVISFVPTPKPISELMTSLISKPKNARILDTGCGEGAFLESLRQSNYTSLTGIELNQKLFSRCQEKSDKGTITLINEDYLDWSSSTLYEVIIGNPPYLHFNSLPETVQNKVERIVGTRESDIYYAFIIKSIERLKEKGELIYIVPYGFMYATYATKLRQKLATNGYFEWIIDLDEMKIFEGENPETLIFKYVKDKANKNQKTKVIRLKTRNSTLELITEKAHEVIEKRKSNKLFEYCEKIFDYPQDPSTIWSTYPKKNIPNYQRLKDIAYIGVGMVSGYAKSFKVDKIFKDKVSDREKELIVPFIKGANCKGYWTEGYQNYILIDDHLKSEEELKKLYPNIYSKLVSNKEYMKTRYLAKSKKWFNWQALRNYEDHKRYLNMKKIYVPTLDRSKKNRFSMTDEEVMPSGDVLAIVALKEDPYFLLGYLNSSFFREYYLSEGARRGHRISYTQKIISNVKIPLFKDERKKEISKITQRIIEKKDTAYRHEIDLIIEKALKKDTAK